MQKIKLFLIFFSLLGIICLYFNYDTQRKKSVEFVNKLKKSNKYPPNNNINVFHFTLKEFSSNKLVDLKDYSKQAILISFWSTSCHGCIYEFPSLEKLHKRFPNIKMFIITMESEEKLIAFFKKQNFDLPFYTFHQTNKTMPKINVWPTTLFFVNKKRIFQIEGTGDYSSSEFNKYIRDFL